MTDHSAPADPATTFLRLETPGPHGTAIGLQAGDLLTGVNGIPFRGTEAHLEARFGHTPDTTPSRICALNVLRGDRCFVVLSARPDLGRLVAEPPSAEQLRAAARGKTGRLYPAQMVNWEVYRNRAGHYDLQPLKPSLLSLVAAPLWLAQMRLWAALAIMVGVVVIASPTGWIMTAAIYGLASIHVWRAGPAIFRADRLAAGFKAHAVIAAAHERGAHAGYAALEPRATFVYAPRADVPSEDGDAPGRAPAPSHPA